MPFEVNYQFVTFLITIGGAVAWCGAMYTRVGALMNDVKELKQAVRNNNVHEMRLAGLEKNYEELHKIIFRNPLSNIHG